MKKYLFLFVILLSSNLVFAQNNIDDDLKKLNTFLETFYYQYYGSMQIKDGYLINNFRDDNNSSKVLISDLDIAVVDNNKVLLKCKASKECVFYTFTNTYTFKL